MKLSDFLTPENLESYAVAAAEIYEIFQSKNIPTIIVPSRGAHPFASVAHSLQYYFTPKVADIKPRLFYLPFTSDFGDEQDLSPETIRCFWTKVMLDLVRKKESPYTKFHSVIADFTYSKFGVTPGDCSCNFSADSGEIMFIDTCISGRAISEIIESMQKLGFSEYFIVAIVDQSRGGPDQKHRRILERERQMGRLEYVNVTKLFSEDQSPLLNNGCGSIVFPNLITEALNIVGEFKNDGLSGAGSCFLNWAAPLQGMQSNAIRGLMQEKIFTHARRLLDPITRTCHSSSNEYIAESIARIESNLGRVPLRKEDTLKLAQEFFFQKNSALSISSSHVLRFDLTPLEINRLLANFQS